MEKEFVTYEQALSLKELEYYKNTLRVYSIRWKKLMDEEYAVRYDVDYAKAPLKQQVFKFFRDEYGYDVDYIRMPKDEVFPITKDSEIKWTVIIYRVYTNDFIDVETYFNTYEEAENACIDKLLTIAKQQKDGII